MKNLLGILALTLFCTFAFAQNKKSQTITIKTKIACDHCLHCESCGANITNHILQETPGIKDVKIDPVQNIITVVYNPSKTNTDKIREAINNAGYDADNKKAPAEAVNKLDGCCKAK